MPLAAVMFLLLSAWALRPRHRAPPPVLRLSEPQKTPRPSAHSLRASAPANRHPPPASASKPQPPPADSAATANSAPPLWQAARAYRTGKTNIYFSRTELLQDLLAHDEEAVQRLGTALAHAPHRDVSEEAPNDEVLDRMAAIDLLEGFAEEPITAHNQADARSALHALALQELPPQLDSERKGVMVGERYDAFTALTRLDPALAFRAYRKLASDARREVLKPALMAGLIDRGVPRGEVTREFERLAATEP